MDIVHGATLSEAAQLVWLPQCAPRGAQPTRVGPGASTSVPRRRAMQRAAWRARRYRLTKEALCRRGRCASVSSHRSTRGAVLRTPADVYATTVTGHGAMLVSYRPLASRDRDRAGVEKGSHSHDIDPQLLRNTSCNMRRLAYLACSASALVTPLRRHPSAAAEAGPRSTDQRRCTLSIPPPSRPSTRPSSRRSARRPTPFTAAPNNQ